MSDDDEVDDGAPLKDGQLIQTLDGRQGIVFWSYREGDAWRVFFDLEDGSNGNALHYDLEPMDAPLKPPPMEIDCERCERPADYDFPRPLCERCWQEWFYDGMPN